MKSKDTAVRQICSRDSEAIIFTHGGLDRNGPVEDIGFIDNECDILQTSYRQRLPCGRSAKNVQGITHLKGFRV